MKKVGIVTIVDGTNYGNRLQNYAVQEVLKKFSFVPITLKNKPRFNNRYNYFQRIKKIFGQMYSDIRERENKIRKKRFADFNKNIRFTKKTISIYNKKINKEFSYFVAGSDQIWKPTYERMSEMDLLGFASPEKRVSLSASFGIEKFPKSDTRKNWLTSELNKFKAISVREDKGKEIVEDLTGRNDVVVLIDPTMMLTSEEWNRVVKKPKQLKTDKFILNYFLGELSTERKKEIDRIAKENDCIVINLLDKNDPFYETGPSEFLYLEKNAFLICTDSFHSCVFAIIFDRPFINFLREDSRVNMNSRLETLLSKFKLEKRRYNGKITDELLKHDYNETYKILDKERKKANDFIKKALDFKE